MKFHKNSFSFQQIFFNLKRISVFFYKISNIFCHFKRKMSNCSAPLCCHPFCAQHQLKSFLLLKLIEFVEQMPFTHQLLHKHTRQISSDSFKQTTKMIISDAYKKKWWNFIVYSNIEVRWRSAKYVP